MALVTLSDWGINMEYRRDIDGLRALAVVPVVMFHAGISSISGGYVGVDVFFVISGYLITKIIYSEINERKFSVKEFYKRRILRIYPALFSLLIVVTFLSISIFPQKELHSYFKSVSATILFSSNILFFRRIGYFSPDASLEPLLHTWSLAVEEQYYIIFPIILFLIQKYSRQYIKLIIIIIFCISIFLSIYFSKISPLLNFYMPFTRAWELMAGSLLAVGIVGPVRYRPLAECAAAIGLLSILVPVFLYDEATVFPGLAAVPPVLGAALIIYCAPGTVVGALLSLRPVVAIGLISYSLYLWHWPVIVFMRLWALGQWSADLTILAIVVSFLLGTASMLLVERPFRRWRKIGDLKIFVSAGAISVALLAFALLAPRLSLMPADHFSHPIAVAERQAVQFHANECLRRGSDLPADGHCILGRRSVEKPVDTVLLGDSHAAQFALLIDSIGRRQDFRIKQLTKAGCPPIIMSDFRSSIPYLKDCPQFVDNARRWIDRHTEIRTVVLAAYWSLLVDSSVAENERTFRGPADRVSDGLIALLTHFRSRGIKVILIDQSPTPLTDPLRCYRIAEHNGWDTGRCLTFPVDSVVRTQAAVDRNIVNPALAFDRSILIVRPNRPFCSKYGCFTRDDAGLLYMDRDHLSPNATTRYAGALKAALIATQSIGSQK